MTDRIPRHRSEHPSHVPSLSQEQLEAIARADNGFSYSFRKPKTSLWKKIFGER